MRKKRHFYLLVIGAFVAANSALAGPVSEDAFVETHVGKCISYSGPTAGTQCYNADGTTNYDDKRYGTDTGTWEYRDGKVCVKWSKETSENCQVYTEEPDGSFKDAGGYSWSLGG
ncbi:MAG: hypothetical protein AAF217_06015 [Pseudomonadota bacterium]